MTSDAGAVLLRETDRRLNLLPRLAACFEDHRQPWLISHTVQEMVAQRVYGLALGYEDLNDHDQLREDPLLAVLSGKARVGEEPLAGKSTLNRLELGGDEPSRYKKIRYRPEALDELLMQVFLEAHPAKRRNKSCWTWIRPTCRWRAIRRAASSTVTTTVTVTCRCISSPASTYSARGCGRRIRTRRPAAPTRWNGSWAAFARPGPRSASSCAPTRASAARS